MAASEADLLKIIDHNQDGALDHREIAHALLKIKAGTALNFDFNNDFLVNEKDQAILDELTAENPMNPVAHKLVYLFDRNVNSQVEVAELVDIALDVVNYNTNNEDLEYDVTGDGKVTGEDFGLVMSFAQTFASKFEMAMKAINTVDENGDMNISEAEAEAAEATMSQLDDNHNLMQQAKFDLNYNESIDDEDCDIIHYVRDHAKA